MKTGLFRTSILFTSLIILMGCKKDSTETYEISGFAQKGPFIVGTDITISELEKDLTPTGRNFYSTIVDKNGKFVIPDVELTSDYIQLMANGYYYHEIYGSNTWQVLTLKSISDISESNSININILTHIETERLKYLIQEENLSFNDAKTKAQKEIFEIFELEDELNLNSEQLDISTDADINKKLIAISGIIQSNRQITELTELLTNINTDIKTDGKLNSTSIQTELITSAVLLNIGAIRKNLSELYNNEITGFEKHIETFINNSSYESKIYFDFPVSSEFGINLLMLKDNYQLYNDSIYCFSTRFENNYNLLFYHMEIERVDGTGTFLIDVDNSNGWTGGEDGITDEHSIWWNLTNFNKISHLPISFTGNGEIRIRINVESDEIGYHYFDKYMKW